VDRTALEHTAKLTADYYVQSMPAQQGMAEWSRSLFIAQWVENENKAVFV